MMQRSIAVCSGRERYTGFGLVEVLVALLVVSMGVLGIAGMQLTGMKQSTNSLNRSKALMLTEDIATRMRINRQGVLDGFYAGYDSSTLGDGACSVKPSPYCQATAGQDAQSCTSEQLATFDLFSVTCGDWGEAEANAGVRGLLPDGAALAVQCSDSPCTDTSTYTLSVSWSEQRTASSDDPPEIRSVQMRLRP